MGTPQFGQPRPGKFYPDRPAAFTVVERDGQIATVRVDFPGGGCRWDLPGGGIDPGEDAARAAVRECGEEAGLSIVLEAEVARADHYFVNEDGHAVNTRGVFFAARYQADAPALKIEDDHTLVWLSPAGALVRLDREAHAWALTAWLRRDRAPA